MSDAADRLAKTRLAIIEQIHGRERHPRRRGPAAGGGRAAAAFEALEKGPPVSSTWPAAARSGE
jgi:hypothetical protein